MRTNGDVFSLAGHAHDGDGSKTRRKDATPRRGSPQGESQSSREKRSRDKMQREWLEVCC